MRIEIKVPSVGESISQVEIGEWVKTQGDSVTKNETLLLLETDKATVELNAPESGTLVEVLKKPGDSAAIGEVIARLESATNGAAASVIHSEPARLDQKLNSEPEATSKVHGASTAEEPSAAPEVSQSGSGDGFVSETAAPQEFAPPERDIEIIATKEKMAQEAQDAEPAADLSSGAAPSRTMGANSMVWLIRISTLCERAPDSQSTSSPEWCASCVRHRTFEWCWRRWNQ